MPGPVKIPVKQLSPGKDAQSHFRAQTHARTCTFSARIQTVSRREATTPTPHSHSVRNSNRKKQVSRSNLTCPLLTPTLKRYQQKQWNSPFSSQIHLIYECVSSSVNLLLTRTQTAESKWSTTTDFRALPLVERILMRGRMSIQHRTAVSMMPCVWLSDSRCTTVWFFTTHAHTNSVQVPAGEEQSKGGGALGNASFADNTHHTSAPQYSCSAKGGVVYVFSAQICHSMQHPWLSTNTMEYCLSPNPREHCQLPLPHSMCEYTASYSIRTNRVVLGKNPFGN